MTVILRDTFTGGDDSDIAGRTPDGGGSGPLALGTWAYAYRASGLDTLAIASGKLVPPAGTLDTVVMVVTGHGLASPDYSVSLTFGVDLPTPGLVFVGPGLGIASDGSEGYLATASIFDDGATYTIYGFSSGSYSVLAQTDSGDYPTPSGEITLTLSREGATLRLFKDGFQILTVDDATYTAIGNPGLELDNSDAGSEPEALCSSFDLDDAPTSGPETPDPCTFLASRHEFYAPARADVDGQPTDAFPGLGTLTKHPSSAALIAEDGSQGWIVGAGRAVYLDTGIEGQIDGDPVALGNDYCADVVVTFPRVTSVNPIGEPPGCTAFPYVTTWRYEITGHDGDFATGPHAITPVDGPVADLLANGGTNEISGMNVRNFSVHDNGQPHRFTLDAWDAVSGADPGSVAVRNIRFYAEVHLPDSDTHEYPDAVIDWAYTEQPAPRTSGVAPFYSAPDGQWTVGGETPDTGYIFGGNALTTTVTPTSGTEDGDGTPVSVAGDQVLELRIGPFDNRRAPTQGGVGQIEFAWDEITLDDTNTIIILCTPPTDPGDTGEGEHAAAEVLVRYDEAADSGYGLRLEFTHEDGVYTGTATLFERTAGAETILLSTGVAVAHDTPYQLRVRVAGTTLVAQLDGTVLGTVTDATHASGAPGFGGFDDGDLPVGQYMYLEQFSVYNPDAEIEPPCEGPPEGPNPYPDPPPPADPIVGIWERRNLVWRLVPLPTADVPSDAVGVRKNLARRAVTPLTLTPPDSFGTRKNLAWRYPVATNGTTQYDPPSPYPPYYDPCELAPPTSTPPDVTIGAPPERLFFAWAVAATQLGPLWTATFQQMGPTILKGISQAGARGSAIFGVPGDKTKFFRNGKYAPDLMDAWIYSLAGTAATVLSAQAAGSFAGLHCADDWENPAIWPPIGLPLTEINRIAGVWKTVFGAELRVMLRARTGQIGGTSMPNIDGIISQMRMTGTEWEAAGRDPFQYAMIELDFCQDRSWILHLSQNFYNGTAVRQPMTAAQVLANGLAWVDAVNGHPHGGAVYGMGGWKDEVSGGYDVTGPDYRNAEAAWRNAMIPLGPPTFP